MLRNPVGGKVPKSTGQRFHAHTAAHGSASQGVCFLTLCAAQEAWLSMSWGVLGGSLAVISRVISRITIAITHIRGLIAPPTTTHEPPTRCSL